MTRPSVLQMIATVLFCWLVMVCASASDLSSQQKRDLFAEAQQAFDQGIAMLATDPVVARQAFAEAASRFQLIVDAGHASGPLLYNLANSYLQSGDIGRAILNYRKAERATPGDANVHNNLQYARSLCRSQIQPSTGHELSRAALGWHDRLPLSWRFVAFAVVNALLWLTLIGMLVRARGGLRWVAVILAVGWLAAGVSVAIDLSGVARRTHGVLLVDDVVVRKGNGIGFQPKYEQPLHAGVEFQVLEQRGEWLSIQLASGEDGWLERQVAGIVE